MAALAGGWDARVADSEYALQVLENKPRFLDAIHSLGVTQGQTQWPPQPSMIWQAIQRSLVGQLESGAILEGAESFQRIAKPQASPATVTKPRRSAETLGQGAEARYVRFGWKLTLARQRQGLGRKPTLR